MLTCLGLLGVFLLDRFMTFYLAASC